MLPGIMSLVLAISHTCSLAPRFSVLRAATLAAHTPSMTSGTHACTQQTQHLDSNQYRDATSGACPDSGLPRAHVGRSTRGLVGRTPLMLLPSSYGSTSGRGLTSCCMRVGEIEPYNGVILPQLARRPPRARFLLSRSDAGTLIISLPSRGTSIKAAISSLFPSSPISSAIHYILNDWATFYLSIVALASFLLSFSDPASFTRGFASVSTRLIRWLRPRNAIFGWPRNAIFGCVGVSWLAVRAFTSATLSVGEFQWEYKETFAGVITTRYRQGPVEELDICFQDSQFELITGNKKISIASNSQLSEEEANWVFHSISAVLAEPSV